MGKKRPANIQGIADKRYEDLKRFLLYRLNNAADVQDLAQEAFMRLLRRSRDETVERPDAYLFRIAANLAYEQRLKGVRTSSIEDVAVDLVEVSELPERRAIVWQRLERISRVMATLPPLPRKALILQRRDGLTYAQIAERLGTTPHMVKKHIATAMQRCRHALVTDDDG